MNRSLYDKKVLFFQKHAPEWNGEYAHGYIVGSHPEGFGHQDIKTLDGESLRGFQDGQKRRQVSRKFFESALKEVRRK